MSEDFEMRSAGSPSPLNLREAFVLASSFVSPFSGVDSGRDQFREAALRLNGFIYSVCRPFRVAEGEEQGLYALDILSTSALVEEFFRIAQHPGFREVFQDAESRLDGRLAPRDPLADELCEDLREAFDALFDKVAWEGQPSFARFLACMTALCAAAWDKPNWRPEIVGLLWAEGRLALTKVAQESGLSWEEAARSLVTSRDRRLAQTPFDDRRSRDALAKLGYNPPG